MLEQIQLPFRGVEPKIEEAPVSGNVAAGVTRLAEEKVETVNAACAANGEMPTWILGADTLVDLVDSVIGKPKTLDEARSMLSSLSGREHRVITGICISKGDRCISRTAETKVVFASLSPEEIEWYLETGEWEGVAGAYRIQGRGACLIESIDGSFSNVMGLPIRTVYGILTELSYPFTDAKR